MTEAPIYGLLAEFENTDDLLRAVRAAHDAGYRRMDAFTPFPVEGLAEALGFRRTKIPMVILLGGIVGCLGGFWMQYWCAVIDYPINIGGRPLNSWPMFIPIMFELTVLAAALTAVLGMLGLNGLPRPYHPLFNVPRFALASRDRYFFVIEATDPQFDLEATRRFLAERQAREIAEVPA